MLETPGQIIEECKPCRDSGDMAFPAVQSLDILEGRLEERLNGPERGADPILGDVKDSGSSPVRPRRRRFRLFVAGGDDRRARADQLAEEGLSPHDRRVIQNVGSRGTRLAQRGKIWIAAHRLKLLTARQFIGEGDKVDRLVPLEELLAGGEDPLVGLSVEMPRVKDLKRLDQCIPIQEDRPEDGSLRLDVLRWDPLKSGLWRTLSHAGGPSRRPPNQTHSRPEPGLRPRCPGGVVQAGQASPVPY